jgi:hypothetical protein
MKYDYFISSRWRNKDQVMELTQKLRQKGKKVYCFFEEKHSVDRAQQPPEVVMAEFENLDWQHDPLVKEIFKIDLNAEKNSESLILLLPAGKSSHIEAGIAYGMGKSCILIGEQKEAESLYLIFSEFYPTIEAFLNSI